MTFLTFYTKLNQLSTWLAIRILTTNVTVLRIQKGVEP